MNMPTLKVYVISNGGDDDNHQTEWLEPTREGVELVRQAVRDTADPGTIVFNVRETLTGHAASNVVAVFAKGWRHFNVGVGRSEPLNVFELGVPSNPWNNAMDNPLDFDPSTGILKLVVRANRSPGLDALVAIVVLKLVNAVKWAKRYGNVCKLSTDTPLSKSTFDAITMRAEQGLTIAREAPTEVVPAPTDTSTFSNGDTDNSGDTDNDNDEAS